MSFAGGQNGPAEQDTTPWGSPGLLPQDAVSAVVLCTPPLPSVENTRWTVDARWKRLTNIFTTTSEPDPPIRRTMFSQGCDIHQTPLTTGVAVQDRQSTPSPGDGGGRITSEHAHTRRVAPPSEQPAYGRQEVRRRSEGTEDGPSAHPRRTTPPGESAGVRSLTLDKRSWL